MVFILKEHYSFLIIVSLIVFSILYLRGLWIKKQLPYNRPEIYLQSRNSKQSNTKQKTVICIGDSITHGSISSNYVENLLTSLGKGYNIVNAGVNGHFAWNVVQRLPQIIACKPDYITVLIGTNDVIGSYNLQQGEIKKRKYGLPELPSVEFFQQNLQLIISELKQQTAATIFIMTIPPISENLQDPISKITQEFNQIIKICAKQNKSKVIDIFALIASQLKDAQVLYNKESKPFEVSKWLLLKSFLKYFVLNMTWNQVAKTNNLQMLTDNIHLSDKAAMIISNAIKSEIKNKY